MQCPACSAEVPEDDLFCEACGARVGPAAPTPQASAPGPHSGCTCGAAEGETDAENYCLRCGRHIRKAMEWDHVEQPVSATFAAVTDRGIRHDRNEDRFAVAQVGAACAMVVCDGVSASRQSELASSAVSQATLASLVKAVEAGTDSEAAMRQAIAAGAANLIAQAHFGPDENPPSTTCVAALVFGGVATIGWLGDSRAYWIDASGARVLTRDHSWMNDFAEQAGLTPEQAEHSPNAHAITRWIGADATEPADPSIARLSIAGPGFLLLCTDGLWNYCATPAGIAKLVQEAAANAPDAVTIARGLVQFAIDRGGHDNITAALLHIEPAASAGTVN